MEGQTPLWLGIYGAVVATAALIAETILWFRSHKERVEVQLEPYVDSSNIFSALLITVINRSEFAIKATVELKGDQHSFALLTHNTPIEARDRFLRIMSEKELRESYHFWGGERVRVVAMLATKQTFNSKWVDLEEWTSKEWERLPRD